MGKKVKVRVIGYDSSIKPEYEETKAAFEEAIGKVFIGEKEQEGRVGIWLSELEYLCLEPSEYVEE